MTSPATTQMPKNHDSHFLFDFGFGVILPILLLIIDPIVFKGSSEWIPGGILGTIRVFVSVAITLGVVAMTMWLLFRHRLFAYSAYFAGIFLMAQIVAFLISTVLLPFSIIGIFISGIGLLGIFPFFIAFVFYSQWRVARADATSLPNRRRSTFISAIIVIAIPLILQSVTFNYVHGAVRDILNNPSTSSAAVSRLKTAFWCGSECYYELALDYYNSPADPARRQYLADIYHQITGSDIYPQITTAD